MKRFTIMAEDGTFLKLYYPTMEVAQEHYPNAKISECHDQSHIEYINKMLASADEHKTMERKGSIVLCSSALASILLMYSIWD